MNNDYNELIKITNKVHSDCFELCKMATGKYLPVAGNIGIFCQSEDEFKRFLKLREQITEPSNNPNQKYFLLKEPIVVSGTVYTYLYIRKPDPTPYGKYLGDLDFVLEPKEYAEFKSKVERGEIPGAEMYDRPGWDTIEITDPNISSVAYISTQEFAEKVRVRFD